MLWWRVLPGLLAILLAGACSNRRDRDLPVLPRLTIAKFKPQIRVQMQKALQAAESEPRDPEANGRLGMLLYAFEQFESAELCYRRARLLDPNRFQWVYYLGLTQAMSGKNVEAAVSLQEALRLDPGYLPARLKTAEVLLSAGRVEESQAICQSMAKNDSQSPPVYYWLGRVAAAKGQVSESIEHYRKACRLWPSYGTAHYALALACERTGKTADAREHMAAYQKYKADGDPQPEDPLLEAVRSLDNTALAHLMRGVEFEKAGQLDAAIAEHVQAVEEDPKLAQAHANLIALYARAGRTGDVEKAYRTTVELNPNLPQSHYDFGVFLVSRERFSEAGAAFRKALESSPGYAEAHSNLGAMLEREGKPEEAMRHYRAAIENKPNFRLARFQLGRLLLMKKRTAEAIAQLSQTLTPEDADTPRFMYALGVAYADAGDYTSAGRYLREAGQRAVSKGQTQLLTQIETSMRRVQERAVGQAIRLPIR